MKNISKLFFVLLFLLYSNSFGTVDIRVSQVSHTYDSPTLGKATLILDIEAQSTDVAININTFQNAIQVNADLLTQINAGGSVVFSEELFPSSDYTTTEDLNPSTGRIRFVYTHSSGSKSQILATWITVVRITIQYTMASNKTGAISWYDGIPNFTVTDGNNFGITGSEGSLPSSFPLPVELSSFTASVSKNAINLKWQTATEVNNYGFEIERSLTRTLSEGEGFNNWEKIGFVPGNGNSNSPKDYTFMDKNPAGGSKFIYRLKQIDNNGKFEYSDEVEVELVPNEFALYQNYPNPFNPATNIQFSLPKAARINLSVYNLLGEKIAILLNEDKDVGFYSVQFDASSFSSGVYIYRLTTGDFIKTMKMNFIK